MPAVNKLFKGITSVTIDSSRRDQIVSSLRDKEYRDAFVADQIRIGVPLQIKKLRDDLKWTQQDVGSRTLPPMVQESVSRLENPTKANLTIGTLLRVASAFDVALIVRFAPFSEFIDSTPWLSGRSAGVSDYANDTGLQTPVASRLRAVGTETDESENLPSAPLVGSKVQKTSKTVVLDGANRFSLKSVIADAA